jgi:hypothetical protein
MRALLILLASASTLVLAAPPSHIAATGTLYVTFDIGMGNHTEGVLIARFVPDAKSLADFPAVTSGQYSGPVKYISFEPPEQVLKAVLGPDEMARLSHDRQRIIQIPVALALKNYKAVVECDSRAYHATLISIKPLGEYQIASRNTAPIGC